MTPIRAIAYGAGVQSTALLVLAATGRIDFPVFLFANTGDDSEDPATIDYLRRHAAPFAAAHGIDLHELRRTRRDGTVETLYGRLTRPGSRSPPIPIRMSNGAPRHEKLHQRLQDQSGGSVAEAARRHCQQPGGGRHRNQPGRDRTG